MDHRRCVRGVICINFESLTGIYQSVIETDRNETDLIYLLVNYENHFKNERYGMAEKKPSNNKTKESKILKIVKLVPPTNEKIPPANHCKFL